MYRNISHRINREEGWRSEIILFTWDENGNPIEKITPYQPYIMYSHHKGKINSIYGTPVIKKEFDNTIQRKKFIDERPEMEYYEVEIPTRQYLQDTFKKENDTMEFAKYPLRVHFIDIEIAIGGTYKNTYSDKDTIKIRKKS